MTGSLAENRTGTDTGFVPLEKYRPKNQKPVIAFMNLYGYESLAVRYLGAAVRKAGYRCLEIYFEDAKRNFFRYPERHELMPFVNLLRNEGVDIVGISVRSSYRKMAALLSEAIREELGIPVIWGSMHPTICPEDSLESADAVCVGDGEVAIVSLLKAMERGEGAGNISGIWLRREDGSIVDNGWAGWVDVNVTPDPEYNVPGKFHTRGGEVFPGDPMIKDPVLTVISARGCPHSCSFCSNPIFVESSKGFLRMRKVDNVIAEIKMAQRYMDVRRIKFYDELFATNKKWTDEFVEKYRAEINLPFDAFLHPHHVSEPLMQKLVSAGASIISMGIESGSERMANEVYGRGISNERVLESIKVINRSGVTANYDLLIDNPLETPEDRKANFEFLYQIPRPFTLFIFSVAHLPGTALTKKLLDDGYITEDDVEGRNDHTLYQWEVSLTHNRPAEERFWLALISLLTKDFIPKPFIKMLSKIGLLKMFPAPLIFFAWTANIVKLSLMVLKRLRLGTITFQEIRRHANLRDIIVK
ncbi:MAG: B12-binding domain-containing radical SAM protein [Nitrospinota bacterium]|nr:B12-binding domain-containing radical SAM protein [Nitrospinota bacterium]